VAFLVPSTPTWTTEVQDLLSDGRKLTTEEAESLEHKIEQHPQDIAARTTLIGYYYNKLKEPSTRKAKQTHILWLIQNAPESEILGTPYGTGYLPN
jgi:hypothetical protein